MIIQLHENVTPGQKVTIATTALSMGYKMMDVKTQEGHYMIGTGRKEFDIRQLGHLPGISDIHRVSDEYKLVSRK